MSLGYMSRVCVRVVQAAVRAEQPASKQTPKPSAPAAAAHHQLQARRSSGGLTETPAKAAVAPKKVVKTGTRRAEKDDCVMHLVCWGPN